MLAEKLAEVEFETLTPSLIGGYDTGCYSYALGRDFYETPRALAIKGCLRWWLRVLLAGALWEAGKSSSEIEREVGEKVGRIFGTTYPPKESSSSGILLRVQPEGSWKIIPLERAPIPRLKVLTQGYREDGRKRWRVSCFAAGLKFKLSLYLRPRAKLEEEEKNVALWATMLYSVFGGVGAITRRGFGALKVVKVVNVKESSFFETLSNFSNYDKITSDAVKNVVKKALESAHKVFGTSPKPRDEIPPFPVLALSDEGLASPGHPVFRSEVKEIEEKSPIDDLLVRLGECTLKIKWKGGRRGSGYPYDTWVLGLPRKAEPQQGVTTGYKVVGDKTERRASAICLKPLANKGRKWKILIYGFLSTDWPQLEHHSAKPVRVGGKTLWQPQRPQRVTKRVEKAFEDAWREVLRLL